ncbi:hypothetical protein QBC43DRAFT_288634 [Cladorrhinum sp. PSN259]|nr:hypothetical protein QBC43DRAFT_288634 [Cladorrhinum sp. PSN259]
MQKGAKEGCSWCQLILLESCTVGEVTIKVTRNTESDYTPKGEKLLRVQLKDSQCGISEQSYLIYTTADGPAANLKHIKARDRIIGLSTPKSFHLAQECIDTCLKTHKDCPQPNLKFRRPLYYYPRLRLNFLRDCV